MEDVKKGPTVRKPKAEHVHKIILTNPTECEEIRSHDLQSPHFTFVMRVRIRNFCSWEERQTEMDERHKYRSQRDLFVISIFLFDGSIALTRPAR